MFLDHHIPLRLAAATLPAPSGYALTRDLTPLLGGARLRRIGDVVRRNAGEFLGDPQLAETAAQSFAASVACDDLDALTARLWPRSARHAWLELEGAEHLPLPGRAVFVTFHISGGFRIFDALRSLGFRTSVITALRAPSGGLYRRIIDHSRRSYLRRELGQNVLLVGPEATRNELRSPAPHLARGSAVVAALDVAPALLGLREVGRATLFGRAVDLPVGLLHLAATSHTPVIPFSSSLERGRRVLHFHPPIMATKVEEILARVVLVLEEAIRARPWDWQGWIDVHRLLVGGPHRGGAAPVDEDPGLLDQLRTWRRTET